tara:strand:+ start:266 stop:475 length:210 start_codon:yes stop_codon:yes gene_type:complete
MKNKLLLNCGTMFLFLFIIFTSLYYVYKNQSIENLQFIDDSKLREKFDQQINKLENINHKLKKVSEIIE